MTNPLKRGTAPGRTRDADLRPGSFKPGHKKLGGRKRGTPNSFSVDYKKAIYEAAYRIGEDGNGKNGVAGYLKWVGERHPRIYFTVLLINPLVLLAKTGSDLPQVPRLTPEEHDRSIRELIGLTANNSKKGRPVEVDPESQWAWTGQPFPVGYLMHLAIVKPKAFCQLLAAAFLRPPTKHRRAAAPNESWPQDRSSSAADRQMLVHPSRRPAARRRQAYS